MHLNEGYVQFYIHLNEECVQFYIHLNEEYVGGGLDRVGSAKVNHPHLNSALMNP